MPMTIWLRTLLSLLMLLAVAATPPARAADELSITGPITHRNLSVYFVHGRSAAGPVPLTLQEALAKKAVVVAETGNVNELTIENKGRDDVFVQSGSIVKGGQQDRVLTVSLLLPPHSGRIPIAVFCVEHGRWSARGKEDAAAFASANTLIPSHDAKMAMKAPPPPATAGTPRPEAGVGVRQQKVWNDVAKMQDELSGKLGAPVVQPQSPSSLQLALENKQLEKAQAEYLSELQTAGEADADIVGFAFAIDGKLNSAEIYPANGLFRKLWRPLLSASITEALANNSGERQAPPPTVDAVRSLLQPAESTPATVTEIGAGAKVLTRDEKDSVSFETRRSGKEDWVQRSYLAK
jgi:hypothetical protein